MIVLWHVWVNSARKLLHISGEGRLMPLLSPKTIGFAKSTYNNMRNVIGAIQNCNYKNVSKFNLYYYLHYTKRALAIKSYEENKFAQIAPLNVDVLHLFNGVCFSEVSWVSTFETILSRYHDLFTFHRSKDGTVLAHPEVEEALEYISKKNCKAIIAMSQSAKKIQQHLLRYYRQYEETITTKLHVLYPPQAVLVDEPVRKSTNKKKVVKFCFVGTDFSRKGGYEILSAFCRTRKKFRCPVVLYIVGNLGYADYARKSTHQDFKNALSVMENNRDWIIHYPSLTNDAVIELMKRVDVGLLPTWADTFGYSILEFQACGCPVITTDVRAISEINDWSSGWLIKVPKNDFGEIVWSEEEEKLEISKCIQTALEDRIVDILDNYDSIRRKGNNCVDRIRRYHDPERYGKDLFDLIQGQSPTLGLCTTR